jgi:hypothetical protein
MNCPVVKCEAAKPQLHYVEAGHGEAVLLLQGSASTGTLWRQTMSLADAHVLQLVQSAMEHAAERR